MYRLLVNLRGYELLGLAQVAKVRVW